MKRTVIITAAGASSRFSKSCGRAVHKSIYQDDNSSWTILLHQLNLVKDISDEIILVTGYQHGRIKDYLEKNFSALPLKIVYNEHYTDYGSCFSLVLGIEAADEKTDELIFMEGDLIFDAASFKKLAETSKDAVTSNNKLIDARTSVIFYAGSRKQIKYLYDPAHNILKIDEPFLIIGNSGQVWKFKDIKKLKSIIKNYKEAEYKDTNLVLINDYFKEISFENIETAVFKEWFNCNTIEDYKKMKEYIKREELYGNFK